MDCLYLTELQRDEENDGISIENLTPTAIFKLNADGQRSYFRLTDLFPRVHTLDRRGEQAMPSLAPQLVSSDPRKEHSEELCRARSGS